MNYIKKEGNKTIIDGKYINSTTTKVLYNLSKKYLKGLDSIIKSTKKLIGIKKYVPIYLDSELLIVPIYGIRSQDFFAFNYYSLRDYLFNDDQITLIFNDLSMFNLYMNKNRFLKLLSNAKKVDSYIKNL